MSRIGIGIGGWTYPPWRGVFYPEGLAQARELEFAGRALTAMEINGTFYGTQKPASFRRWADEVPDGFTFTLKGPRYATHRRVLAEAGESIDRFFGSGITELKGKLGPVLWQFPPTKRFDEEDFAAFLALLPSSLNGRTIRHAMDVRHESFRAPAFLELLRKAKMAVAYTDAEKYPQIADVTADFVYARLQRAEEDVPAGYPPAALKKWAERARLWAEGGQPADLPRIEKTMPPHKPRDVFIFMINGAKLRAPAAAMALIKRIANGE